MRPRGGRRKMTRHYETAFIFSAALDDAGLEQEMKNAEELIAREGGTVGEWDKWGRRKLAFPIKKQAEGVYGFLRFECEPHAIATLGAAYRLNESVVRHMTICLDD